MNEFELMREADMIRVDLEGDLTAIVVPELKSALQESLESGILEVEFNLEKTKVIDSTGIGLLIATYNSLMKRNGTVRTVQVSEDIFRLLQSMRLEKRLCVSTH